MGTNVSKSVSDVVNESVMEVTTTIDTEFKQEIYNGSLVNQINDFAADGEISGCCGNLVTQENDTTTEQYIAAELTNDQSVELIQNLVNKLDAKFEKELKQKGSFVPGLNVAETKSNVKTILNSLVENEILISTVQETSQTSAVLQQNNVKVGNITCPCIHDKDGKLVIFESMFDMTNRVNMSQVAEAMADQVLEILADTDLEQDLKSLFKEKTSQTGFDFNLGIILAIVIGIIVLGIVARLFLKSRGKGRAPQVNFNPMFTNTQSNSMLKQLLNNRVK